ncbi:hypothetical protein MW374_004508 [Vibrio parahaemolyticus]|nr:MULTISPECIES: hypothetical protein [Vibrio]AGR00065.1 hypothetical protein M636_13065 [Vibrio parahaemolyticus O1:K33 str. CDC_K4557]EGQ7893728.1 hypothetical protein [Vibrio parahaemolyticus]EGQ8478989.1 hypothetical protein [Vibrio parahaemolyticus]EGQ9152407.1 hypothetical protein [Vibrio parahaemolyticus]EGQ9886407.1 hypothetical protein [Vibrio parahaemolyticus]
MIKIGNLEVILSEQLLIPKQEDCYIDYDDGQGNNFALKIKFEETDEKDEKGERASSFRVEPQSDCGLLIFTNWLGVMGRSFNKPVAIGKMETDRELFINAHVSSNANTYKAHFQLMLGDVISE